MRDVKRGGHVTDADKSHLFVEQRHKSLEVTVDDDPRETKVLAGTVGSKMIMFQRSTERNFALRYGDTRCGAKVLQGYSTESDRQKEPSLWSTRGHIYRPLFYSVSSLGTPLPPGLPNRRSQLHQNVPGGFPSNPATVAVFLALALDPFPPLALITLPRPVGFGEPWISGNVNLPQGKVDLKFRIRGDKGTPVPCLFFQHGALTSCIR